MKKKAGIFLIAAAVFMLTAGCQKKYEEIKLDEDSTRQETAFDKTMAETGFGTEEVLGQAVSVVGIRAEAESETGRIGADISGDGELFGYPAEGQFSADTSTKETMSAVGAIPAMETVDETVFVIGDQVNLRALASTDSEIVAVFSKGVKLHRTGYGNQWSQVEYEGMTCYIASEYISTAAPEIESVPFDGKASGQGIQVALDSSWKYSEFSKIHSGMAMLYQAEGDNRKGITICVNAGHGTSGGSGVKTLCHPDGTPKVTGGTTSEGATSAVAVSSGMTFADGTAEAKVTLAMAKKLKSKLLDAGYDVLMIRETDDVQLDNIARTVIANYMADCHIALHWDSTTSNKGAFYMSVPNVSSYRNMEPVKSNWERHHALGESLIAGLKSAGVKIFSGGSMAMDLTQTSYSTVPSIDIELGDKASDHSEATLDVLAAGLLAGINQYFGQ